MKTAQILIIDDEEQDRKILATILKKAGYNNVSGAATGWEGLELVKSLKPALVIIDVVLTGIDGFDICRQIKAAEGVRVKVLMVTGHLDAVNAEKARHSGADELIEKKPGFGNAVGTIDNLIKCP